MTSSKIQIDRNYENRETELRAACNAVAAGLDGTQGVDWMLPADEWNEDLQDWDGLKQPFSRDKINEQLLDALKSDDPCTMGDVVVGSVEIDMLSQMERAFRSRHCMSQPRVLALHAGRMKGHGNVNGVLGKGHLDYLRRVLREGAS